MTLLFLLLEYLKTNPKDDAKRLLVRYQGNTWPLGCDSSCDHALWSAVASGLWVKVEISQIQSPRLSCYYRRSELGFIVSDCGESISDLIRRTGLEAEAAQDRVHQICEDGISLDDVNAPGLDVFAIRCQCKADRLAEAIIAVLSVVARVREAS